MTYTINARDINYNSSSDEIEALRRAVEIRSIHRELDRLEPSSNGVETYVWETPLRCGALELETVTICEESGLVTYSRREIAQAC